MTDQSPFRTRIWLFTPTTRPDRFAKAAAAGADVAILDLEDAVAPKDKAQARRIALDYLADEPADGLRHALRINGLDTRAGISDLEVFLGSTADPDFLVLPKTETSGHLQILDRLLGAVGKRARLVGIIESARGLAAVEAIAAATARLAGLMLGAADMAADLRATTAWEPLAFARGRLVAACALAGVMPIDAPFFDLRDQAGLKQEVAVATAFGFDAKAAIHPAQVAVINAALTPTAEAVQKARAILAENAKGVGSVDGRMIDLDEDGTERRETSVLAHFISLAQLEKWSASHKTHLAIYNHAIAMNRKYKQDREVVSWHELFVNQVATFEYVNCHPRTGLLPYFEPVAISR